MTATDVPHDAAYNPSNPQLELDIRRACEGRSLLVDRSTVAKEIFPDYAAKHVASILDDPEAPAPVALRNGKTMLFVRAELVRYALTRPRVSQAERQKTTAAATAVRLGKYATKSRPPVERKKRPDGARHVPRAAQRPSLFAPTGI